MPSGPSLYDIAPADESQFDAIAELLHQTFGGGVSLWLDRFEHSWIRNPAWSKRIPRGWAATGRDGSVSGYMMNTPFHYQRPNGAPLICCAVHSLAVRPDARGAGLARGIAEASLRQKCDFIVATQTSAGGWGSGVSAGMLPLDAAWTREARVTAVDLGALVKLVSARTPLHVRPLLEAIGRVLKPAAGVSRKRVGVDVGQIAGFDASDDPDLRRLEAGLAAIRPRRDSSVLNWLYFGTPHLARSRLVLAARRHGRIVGYAGFRCLPNWLGLLECRTLPEEVEATLALFESARAWARARGMTHILSYPYSAPVKRALPWLMTFRAPRRITYPYLAYIKTDGLNLYDLELGPWDGDAVITDDTPALDGVLVPAGGAEWA